jgi:putative membrane protein
MSHQMSRSFDRDHLANERTFLAWIRTNLGIMAFGFVVEKFSLFMREMVAVLGQSALEPPLATPSHLQGYSSIFGVSLVAIAVILSLFAFLKFKKIEKQINSQTYQPSRWLDTLLALFVCLIGVCLIAYLIMSRGQLSIT